MKEKGLKIGDRVLITGNHPWAGHTGKYAYNELVKAYGAMYPVIQLDNGTTCFVMKPEQFKKVK